MRVGQLFHSTADQPELLRIAIATAGRGEAPGEAQNILRLPE